MQDIHDYVLSVPDGSVYVPDASLFDENRIFSGRLTYDKGSAIIHTLRFEMQDDSLFFHTLKNYQQQFKDSVATASDFKFVAETTCGRDFTDFFNQWYYGEGYPTFNITYYTQGDSIVLEVNETVSAPAITPFFKGLYEFTITSPQGDTTVKANVTSNNQQFRFAYNKIPAGIIVDPNNWVLNLTGTIINGGVLPVKLTDFEANERDCAVSLKWKTTNEAHIKQYEVEYSTDGINFARLTAISSHNSNIESTYEYSHSLTTGALHFFRLKIVDLDGSYSYSPVKSIHKNCGESYSLEILPNPVHEKIFLKIVQPVAGNTLIKIFDSRGAVMYKDFKFLNAGENRLELPALSFSNGTYTLTGENAAFNISRRFIKM